MTEEEEEDTDLAVPLIYDSGDLDLFPPHCQKHFLQQPKKMISGLQVVNSSTVLNT